MTEKPPYSPGCHGPTLLFIFQDYVLKGATPEAAAARLDGEVESGEIEARPPLKPGSRLEPKQGLRCPRLVVDAVNHTKTASETEFYYGPPRLDVVDADGTRTGAENFYGCRRAKGPMVVPDPYEPPWVSKLIASAAGIVPPPPVPVEPVEPVEPVAPMTAKQRRVKIETWTTSWLNDKSDIENRDRDHYKAAAKAATEKQFGKKIPNAGFYRALKATGRTKYGPKMPPPKNNSRA